MMNIFALRGHKVRFLGKHGHDWQLKEALEHLEVDKVYTVSETHVHSSSTSVYLQEVPGISFNSVQFEDVEEQLDELTRLHPDFKRYN